MSEKVKQLNLQRDYKNNLYFIDGEGNVIQRAKAGGAQTIVAANALTDRDKNFMYFVDKDGDIARSPRAKPGANKKKEQPTT